MLNLVLENPILEKFKSKIKTLSNHDFLGQKFGISLRKFQFPAPIYFLMHNVDAH